VLAALAARPDAERTRLDVGCFQLNVGWHGRAFDGIAAMIDPAGNARYAARFLAALHDETGDWSRAAAAYHSRRPGEARAYLDRVSTAVASLPGSPLGAAPAEGPRTGNDATRDRPARSLGSLVSLGAGRAGHILGAPHGSRQP
jgi:hypothetical protein